MAFSKNGPHRRGSNSSPTLPEPGMEARTSAAVPVASDPSARRASACAANRRASGASAGRTGGQRRRQDHRSGQQRAERGAGPPSGGVAHPGLPTRHPRNLPRHPAGSRLRNSVGVKGGTGHGGVLAAVCRTCPFFGVRGVIMPYVEVSGRFLGHSVRERSARDGGRTGARPPDNR